MNYSLYEGGITMNEAIINTINKLWADAIDGESNLTEYEVRDIINIIRVYSTNELISAIDQLSRNLLVNEYQKVISDIQTNDSLEDALARGQYVSQHGLEFQKKVDELKKLIATYD